MILKDFHKIEDIINCEGSILSLYVRGIDNKTKLFFSSRTNNEDYLFFQISLRSLKDYFLSTVTLNDLLKINKSKKYLLQVKSSKKMFFHIKNMSNVELVFGDVYYEELNKNIKS